MHRHRRGSRRHHHHQQQHADVTVDDAEVRQSLQLTTVPDLMSAMTLFRVVEEPPSPQRSTGSTDTTKRKAEEEKGASPTTPLDPLPGLFELYRGRSDDAEDDAHQQQQVEDQTTARSPVSGDPSTPHRIRFGRPHVPNVNVSGAGAALGWFGRWTTKTSMSPNRPPTDGRRRTNGEGDDDDDDEDDDDDDEDEDHDDTTVKANPGRGDEDVVDREGARSRKKPPTGSGGRQLRSKAVQAAAAASAAAANAKKKTRGGKVRRRMNWRVAAMGGGPSAVAGASSSRGGRRTPDHSDESSSVGGGARGVISTTGSTTTSRSNRSFHTLFSTETPRLSNTTPPQFLEYDYTTEERSVHTEDLVKAGRLSGQGRLGGAGGAEAEFLHSDEFVREWANSGGDGTLGHDEFRESPKSMSQSKGSAGSPSSRKSSSSRLQSQAPSRLPISRYSPTEAMMRMRRDDPSHWSKEELYRQAQLILWGKDTPPSSTRGSFHTQSASQNHDALTNAVLHGAANGDGAMPDASLPSDEGGDYMHGRGTADELEGVFGVYSSQEQLAIKQAAARGADIAAAADDVAELRGQDYDYDFETDEDEDELGVAAAQVAGVGRRNSRGVEFQLTEDDAIGEDVDHVAHLLSQSSSSDMEFDNDDDDDDDGLPPEFCENHMMARRYTLGAGSLGHVDDDEPTQGSAASTSSSDGTPIPAAPPATSEAWEMNRSPDMSTLTSASERKFMEGNLGDTESSPPAPSDAKRYPTTYMSPSSVSIVSPPSLSPEDQENPPPPPPLPAAGVDADGNPLRELYPPDFGVSPGSLSSLAAGSSLMLDKNEYRSAPSFSARQPSSSDHDSRGGDSMNSTTSADKKRRRRRLRRPDDASFHSQGSASTSTKGSSASTSHPPVLRPRRPQGHDFGGSHDQLAVSHSPSGRSLSSSSTSSSKRRKSPAPVDLDDGRFVHAERHLRAIHDLAAEHLAHNEFEEALEVFEEILRGQQQRYGKKHPRIGTALHNIAIVHMRSKNYDAAVATCAKAVYVRKDALGDEHPDVAVSLAQLGIAHLECKEHRAALVSFREALRIRRKLLDRNHPKVAKILNNIGCCLFELNDLKGSMAAFQEALAIQRRMMRLVSGDADDPADTPNTRKSSSSKSTSADPNKILLSVAASLCNIGSIRLRRREYEESIVALEEALLIQQSVLGDDHPTVLNTLESIELVEMTKFEFTERVGADQSRSRFGTLGEEPEVPPSPTCSTSIPDSTPIMGACTTVPAVSSAGGAGRSSTTNGGGASLPSFLPAGLMGSGVTGVGGGGGIVERRRRWYQRVVEDFASMGAGTMASTESFTKRKVGRNLEKSPQKGSFDSATKERLSTPDRSTHRGPSWM